MQTTAIFKSLTDHNRLCIALMLITEPELCVCELTEALQLPQPKVSQLLANLKKSALLQSRRQGQWIYYRINSQLQPWAVNMLQQLQKVHPELTLAPQNRLQQMGNRPARVELCCP